MTEPLRLASFDELLGAMERLPPTAGTPGPWTLPQALAHCAQSIDYSVTGFPRLKSALFRATAGRLAARAFLKRGFLGHDLGAPIPGAPTPAASLRLEESLGLVREAIGRFRAFTGELQPHFAYGRVARADYEKLHAMHAADHLIGAL